MSGGLLSASDFARALGVCPETVRRWVRGNLLHPAGRTPTGRLRFAPEQVQECLAGPPRRTERAQNVEAQVAASMAAMRLLRRSI